MARRATGPTISVQADRAERPQTNGRGSDCATPACGDHRPRQRWHRVDFPNRRESSGDAGSLQDRCAGRPDDGHGSHRRRERKWQGTGRAAYPGSTRSAKPFRAVNWVPSQNRCLKASPLGMQPGAGTGTTGAKPGLFEEASGGTLFLDLQAMSDPRCRWSYYGCSRNRKCGASAVNSPFGSMSVSLRPRTGTCGLTSRMGVSRRPAFPTAGGHIDRAAATRPAWGYSSSYAPLRGRARKKDGARRAADSSRCHRDARTLTISRATSVNCLTSWSGRSCWRAKVSLRFPTCRPRSLRRVAVQARRRIQSPPIGRLSQCWSAVTSTACSPAPGATSPRLRKF